MEEALKAMAEWIIAISEVQSLLTKQINAVFILALIGVVSGFIGVVFGTIALYRSRKK